MQGRAIAAMGYAAWCVKAAAVACAPHGKAGYPSKWLVSIVEIGWVLVPASRLAGLLIAKVRMAALSIV